MTDSSIYESVIGLEVHAQLLTRTKIFCSCPAEFTTDPNVNVCPVCLGHPGVLPVLNKQAVEFAVMIGTATNCTVNNNSVFARKNYFYPDLPKGFQISQYDKPICENGFLEIRSQDGEVRRIGITRIHLEEDAGKSIHDSGFETSIDVNRCGTPLTEIVSEPDMRSAEEAVAYLAKLRQLVQYLGICDGNMEEGSFRCDANVSIRKRGESNYGTKTELKNMNSFRNVEKAINYEISRQIGLLEDGKKVVQQTMLWDADQEAAFPMRGKEEAHDYRYFPEPDLMPVFISQVWLNETVSKIPELPESRKNRFVEKFRIPVYDAEVLTQSREVADYYEQVTNSIEDYKIASNWVMVEVLGKVNELKTKMTEFPVSPARLGSLLGLIADGTISNKIAKEVFAHMLTDGSDPIEIVKQNNLLQISDSGQIRLLIEKIVDLHPAQLQEYFEGKDKVLGFFVGKVMKESGGKANPQIVNETLKEVLTKHKEKK